MREASCCRERGRSFFRLPDDVDARQRQARLKDHFLKPPRQEIRGASQRQAARLRDARAARWPRRRFYAPSRAAGRRDGVGQHMVATSATACQWRCVALRLVSAASFRPPVATQTAVGVVPGALSERFRGAEPESAQELRDGFRQFLALGGWDAARAVARRLGVPTQGRLRGVRRELEAALDGLSDAAFRRVVARVATDEGYRDQSWNLTATLENPRSGFEDGDLEQLAGAKRRSERLTVRDPAEGGWEGGRVVYVSSGEARKLVGADCQYWQVRRNDLGGWVGDEQARTSLRQQRAGTEKWDMVRRRSSVMFAVSAFKDAAAGSPAISSRAPEALPVLPEEGDAEARRPKSSSSSGRRSVERSGRCSMQGLHDWQAAVVAKATARPHGRRSLARSNNSQCSADTAARSERSERSTVGPCGRRLDRPLPRRGTGP
ncbi:unnamed protein product [Prorocentrum cordatum]|uniref:Uncharacterized protein n=1 Tax=Prorocentrum cordatum TaxID=2364126 RepID=A0ABN9PA19_9DINO|nr:unnamed protein product [Polarella glacialis]